MAPGICHGTGRRRFRTAAAAAACAAAAALWLWCARGGSSLIRLVAQGDRVTAYIDGRLVVDAADSELPPDGGIGIWYEPSPYWGVPFPQRLESLRVTDLSSGAVLLEQGFDRPLSEAWTERRLPPAPRFASLGRSPAPPARLCTGPRPWRDYRLDLRVRNLMAINVAVRYSDARHHAVFFARPFRELDSGVSFLSGGAPRTAVGGSSHYSARAAAKNGLLLFLRFLPCCALAIIVLPAAGCLVGAAVSRVRNPRAALEALFVAALFAGAFVYLSWITRVLLEGIPHVQDSVAYDFQAKTLARGALYAPAPPNPPSFDFQFLIIRDGKWFGQYPWGHPLLLMFGHLARAPWAVPPLVGACVLAAVYFIGRSLFGREVGAVSALLALSSPFFQINAPNFMSHSAASLYLAMGLLFLRRASRAGSRWWWGLLSGAALGLLFNTRPLNALPAIALSFGLLLFNAARGRASWGSTAAFCAGALMGAAAFLCANYVLMGDPFRPPYSLTARPIGFFGPSHPPGAALLHLYTSMTLFVMVVLGWPPVFTVGFFLAYLVLSRRDSWSLFLPLLFAGMAAVNTLNPAMVSPAHMYGPRYVYEPFFVFIIMAAAGWDLLRRLFERGIARCAAALPSRAAAAAVASHALFILLLAALVFASQAQWLSRGGRLFEGIAFLPGNIHGLKGFNFVSGAMREKIARLGMHRALLFLEDREIDWWYYGALFPLNSPFLDSDIVVARDLGPEENRKVMEALPGRKPFRVSVRRQEVSAYR